MYQLIFYIKSIIKFRYPLFNFNYIMFFFTLSLILIFSGCIFPFNNLDQSSGLAIYEYYVSPKYGDDRNTGSLSSPWKTLTNSIPKLTPGDTLYLRGGTYYESGIEVGISGTKSHPIKIRNYEGEKPTLDGGYLEFRKTPNYDWELYDVNKKIYRSIKTYPDSTFGYFIQGKKKYKLVTYSDYADMASNNEDFTENGNTYIGPGVIWNSLDKHIYIRLKPSKKAIEMGYSIPNKQDPRQVEIYLSPESDPVIYFEGTAAHLIFDGFDIKHCDTALEYLTGSHNITVNNSKIIGGAYPILIGNKVHDLIFDKIDVLDYISPWIAWIDVKYGKRPGQFLQGSGIEFEENTHNIEIKNSNFINQWDNINIFDNSYNINIHHNNFLDTRDDVIEIGAASYNIEVAYNKMINVSKGISYVGSQAFSKRKGNKYIHHNIIDATEPMLYGRNDPNKELDDDKFNGPSGDGMGWNAPIASHDIYDNSIGDPWKIYNNTFVFSKDIHYGGSGSQYMFLKFDSGQPHEVYNNIFVQTYDSWLIRYARVHDGSQIFDGNIYYRPVTNSEESFFLEWSDRKNVQSFNSLVEFKKSNFFLETQSYYRVGWENSGIEANPQLDSEYRPNPKGPAASGAINLSSKNWPGIDGEKYRGALPPK